MIPFRKSVFILDVLLRKHKSIKSRLGVSISLPTDTKQVMQALMQGLLLRGKADQSTQYLSFMYEGFEEEKKNLHTQWDVAVEKRSRTVFAQQTIKVEEVARELDSVRAAIGSGVDVERFVREAVTVHKGVATNAGKEALHLNLKEVPRALRDILPGKGEMTAKFELPVTKPIVYLNRTHPVVEGFASYVMETALDGQSASVAKRSGVTRTSKVQKRTTLLLVRYRFHIVMKKPDGDQQLLAEDCQLLAFGGAPEKAEWLDPKMAENLIQALPEGNITPDMAREYIKPVVAGYNALLPHLEKVARQRGDEILESHLRVRTATRARGVKYEVEPKLPPDVLGVYVFLPKN